MSDDVDAPHGRRLTCADGAAPGDLLRDIVASGYLPAVAGGVATGSARAGAPLAVIAQGEGATLLPAARAALDRLDVRDGVLHLHFSDHAQASAASLRMALERPAPRART
jgi:hypothetical protein